VPRYLLDTNMCIAAMRGHPTVIQHLASMQPGDCAVSTITGYELYTGVQKCAKPDAERAKVDLLLGMVYEVAFDSRAAKEAARIRALLEHKGEMIGPYDVLLAGQAVADSLAVVTANTAEFGRVPGLTVENWTR
jgi:tRNA(fMet)-specific endonuclease VapC